MRWTVLSGVAAYAWWRAEHPDEGAAPNGAITSARARDVEATVLGTFTADENGDFTTLTNDWSLSLKGNLLAGGGKGKAVTGLVLIRRRAPLTARR